MEDGGWKMARERPAFRLSRAPTAATIIPCIGARRGRLNFTPSAKSPKCRERRFLRGEQRLFIGEKGLFIGEKALFIGEKSFHRGEQGLFRGEKAFLKGERRLFGGERRACAGGTTVLHGDRAFVLNARLGER
jgi:hypothetical protein